MTLVPVSRADHFENAARWLSDSDVTHYLGDAALFDMFRNAYTFDELERGSAGVHFAILDENGEHIGFVGMEYIDAGRRVASGYVLVGERSRWGYGYATEASRLAIAYVFEELGIHRLEIAAFAENIASLRVLQKSGFHREGIKRQCVFWNGRWHDVALGAMLREDYFALIKRRRDPHLRPRQPYAREGVATLSSEQGGEHGGR